MEIYRIACQLFEETWKGEKEKIRNIGVRVFRTLAIGLHADVRFAAIQRKAEKP